MLLGNYEFNCQFESQAILPYYKGSTFRGVFGQALKAVVCALRNLECESCLLNEKCIYALLFEAHQLKAPADMRVVSPPHPFVIEPPLTGKTSFPEGSLFDFNLILFGQVNHNLPYFIYAFDRMGKIGIGKKVEGKRGQFILKSVKSMGQIVYSNTNQVLNTPELEELIFLQELNSHFDKSLRLTLRLETPLRLKFENRLVSELPFHILVRAMLRRVSTLMSSYGYKSPSIDYSGLVREAQKVRIVDNSLRWFDWKRYSSRQDKNMLMGGIIGKVTYEGLVGPFLNLIEFCSKVHIGKQTSFGLGKFSVGKE